MNLVVVLILLIYFLGASGIEENNGEIKGRIKTAEKQGLSKRDYNYQGQNSTQHSESQTGFASGRDSELLTFNRVQLSSFSGTSDPGSSSSGLGPSSTSSTDYNSFSSSGPSSSYLSPYSNTYSSWHSSFIPSSTSSGGRSSSTAHSSGSGASSFTTTSSSPSSSSTSNGSSSSSNDNSSSSSDSSSSSSDSSSSSSDSSSSPSDSSSSSSSDSSSSESSLSSPSSDSSLLDESSQTTSKHSTVTTYLSTNGDGATKVVTQTTMATSSPTGNNKSLKNSGGLSEKNKIVVGVVVGVGGAIILAIIGLLFFFLRKRGYNNQSHNWTFWKKDKDADDNDFLEGELGVRERNINQGSNF